MPSPRKVVPTWINLADNVSHAPGSLHCQLASFNGDFCNTQVIFRRNNQLFFLAQNLNGAVNLNLYQMWWNSDGTGTFWQNADGGNAPIPLGAATGLEASWYQPKTLIQGAPDSGLVTGVFCSVHGGPPQGWVVQSYNMDTHAWVGGLTPSVVPTADGIGNFIIRHDGVYVVFYQPSGSTLLNTLHIAYSFDQGQTWASLDGAVNGNQPGLTRIETVVVSVVLDDNDNIHFSYNDGSANLVCTYQRLNKDLTLGPFVNFSTLPNGNIINQRDGLLIFQGQLVQVVQLVNPIPGITRTAVYVSPLTDPTKFVLRTVFDIANPPFEFPTHSSATTDGAILLIATPKRDDTLPIAFRHTTIEVCFTSDLVNWSSPQTVLDPTVAPIPLITPPSSAKWIGEVIRATSFQMSPTFEGLVYAVSTVVTTINTGLEAAFFYNFTGLLPTTPIIPTPNIPMIPIPIGGGGPGPGGNPSDGTGSGGGGTPGGGGPDGKGPWSAGWWCCFLCDQPKWTKLRNPILRSKSIPYASRTKHVR